MDIKNGRITWADYEKMYRELLAVRRPAVGTEPATFDRICLLCTEKSALQCHRRLAAAIREAKEELDIDILPEDIEFSHFISNLASRTESFDFFFTVKKFTGTIRNCEGDKCVEMRYMTLDEVNNTKNVVSTTRQVLNAIANGQTYSELKEYK